MNNHSCPYKSLGNCPFYECIKDDVFAEMCFNCNHYRQLNLIKRWCRILLPIMAVGMSALTFYLYQ